MLANVFALLHLSDVSITTTTVTLVYNDLLGHNNYFYPNRGPETHENIHFRDYLSNNYKVALQWKALNITLLLLQC